MIEFEEKNNDAKRMIVELKNKVLEVERALNNLEQQLKKNITRIWKTWRRHYAPLKELDEESIKSKFENSSRTSDEILSFQRPSSDKSGLGFDKEKKPRYSSCTNQDGNKRSYDVVLSPN